MICIKIPECTGTEEEMADLLEHIAGLIREGFTSGFHPGWELTDVTTTRSA